MKRYFLKIGIGFDIFLCSFIPNSKSRQTISGYLGTNFDGSVFERTINAIFYKNGWWKGVDHCSDCAEEESRCELIN